MNKQISTRVGAITGILIIAYMLIIRAWIQNAQSALAFGSYLILMLGVLASTFLLYKHYTAIRFLDAFSHCVKTSITAIVIILIGTSIMYFVLNENRTFREYNIHLMYLIFSFTSSGLLSSLFSSIIFNIFAKQQK